MLAGPRTSAILMRGKKPRPILTPAKETIAKGIGDAFATTMTQDRRNTRMDEPIYKIKPTDHLMTNKQTNLCRELVCPRCFAALDETAFGQIVHRVCHTCDQIFLDVRHGGKQ